MTANRQTGRSAASKPTVEELGERLGVGVDDLPWRTSGQGTGMFQVAIVWPRDGRADEVWVLVRLQGEADVQVFSRHEWECWLDGVHRGEFDDLL